MAETNVRINIDATGAKRGSKDFTESMKKIGIASDRQKDRFDELKRRMENFDKAGDKSTKTLKKIEKETKRTATEMKKLNKNVDGAKSSLALMAKATAVLVFLKKVGDLTFKTAEAFSKEQIELIKLNQILRTTGNEAEITSKELEELAESLSGLTGTSKTTILNAEAMALTFTRISKDIFPEVIERALDLQTVFGGDLKSSIKQIGKALTEPATGLTALKRIGITFTKEQQELIKTLTEENKLFEAQKVILNELERELGGTAKAIRKEFVIEAQVMKNEWEEFLKVVGERTEPALKSAFKFISGGLNEISKIIRKTTEGNKLELWQRFFKETEDLRPDVFTDWVKSIGEAEKAINDFNQIKIIEKAGLEVSEERLRRILIILKSLKEGKISAGEFEFQILDPERLKKANDIVGKLEIKLNKIEETTRKIKEEEDERANALPNLINLVTDLYEKSKIENYLKESIEFGEAFGDLIASGFGKAIKTIDEVSKKSKTFKGILVDSAEAFTESFADSLMEGKLNFDNFFKDILNKLLQLQIQKSITNPLFASLKLPGFANGGRPTPNQVSIVGEKGPELFVPDTAGTIIPNNKLGGGSVTNVNIINNTGAEVQQTSQRNGTGGEDLTIMIGSAVSDQIENGGAVRNSLENIYGLTPIGV